MLQAPALCRRWLDGRRAGSPYAGPSEVRGHVLNLVLDGEKKPRAGGAIAVTGPRAPPSESRLSDVRPVTTTGIMSAGPIRRSRHQTHSARNATTGSTCVARRAGR